jgi:NADH-quinone oxidoreductase subunit N
LANYFAFLPETVLVGTALASVVLGFAWSKRPTWLWGLALGGVSLALVLTFDLMGLGISRVLGLPLWPSPLGAEGDFSSTLRVRVDPFALIFHTVFLFVAFLAILASRGFVKAEEPHQGEYYGLMLLSVVGMMFTAAATDLFVLFLAFEISSLSLFALVAFRKKDRQATEAAVKFFIIGALSSAIILFGISLVYGVAGTAFAAGTGPPECVGNLTGLTCLSNLTVTGYPQVEPPLIVALVFLIAGFGFKVATVPFHMWAPDVYQGSPTTISVFLAAGSKKVGIVAMFRVFLIGLLGVQVDWIAAIAILAIATQTVGNVLAIPQRSVKRMLAYSSIAQAGYILIAIPVAATAAQSSDPSMGALAEVVAVAGLVGGILHVLTHAAMKAGSFLVVAGTETGGIPDDMDSYRGLGRRMPFLAFSMTIFLLSLAGIPPLGGFFSKFILFSSAVSAMPFSSWFLALALSGVLNSALSLYYYARVIWYMYILEPEGDPTPIRVPASITAAVAAALAVVILVTFLVTFFYDFLASAAAGFFGF